MEPLNPLIFNANPDTVDMVTTYNGSTDLPVDAGTYEVSVSVNDPNYFGSATVTMIINPAGLVVAADDQIKIYGEPDPDLTYTITSGTLFGSDELTGELTWSGGENAGTYTILQGTIAAGPNYSLSFVPGTLTINPANATVTADTQVIFEGDLLPDFTFTFSGFVNGDDESVVTNTSYTLNPNFNGNAGIYDVIPQATALNYIFTPVDGTLYVNPFGPGTKHLIPKLLCVDDANPVGGYDYVAYFQYTNNNNSPVYIPKGEDNNLESAGSYDDSNQPELFLSGTNTFGIPFDGSDLSWTLASYNQKGQKTSEGASANSSSPKCNKGKSAEIEQPENNSGTTVDLKAYPNPVNDKVYINLYDYNVTEQNVNVYNIYGNLCDAPAQMMDKIMEIDLTGMVKGMYFIKIRTATKLELIKVIKQ